MKVMQNMKKKHLQDKRTYRPKVMQNQRTYRQKRVSNCGSWNKAYARK